MNLTLGIILTLVTKQYLFIGFIGFQYCAVFAFIGNTSNTITVFMKYLLYILELLAMKRNYCRNIGFTLDVFARNENTFSANTIPTFIMFKCWANIDPNVGQCTKYWPIYSQ